MILLKLLVMVLVLVLPPGRAAIVAVDMLSSFQDSIHSEIPN